MYRVLNEVLPFGILCKNPSSLTECGEYRKQ